MTSHAFPGAQHFGPSPAPPVGRNLSFSAVVASPFILVQLGPQLNFPVSPWEPIPYTCQRLAVAKQSELRAMHDFFGGSSFVLL